MARVVEDKKGIRIVLGNVEVKGYKDESGNIYYLTKCLKCGQGVRQYVNRRGPKRLYCDNCKASGGVKIEDGKIVTKRGVLEIVE
jgi:RNase P subunit RPR2